MKTFLDFHCHVADKQYSSQEILNIIDICYKENVTIFSMSTNLEDYQINLKFSNFPNVFIGFGIHPYEAHKIIKEKNWQEKIEEILKNKHSKLVFIGEIGLDFYRIPETSKEQMELLEYFVYLSSKYELPLSLHTRNAEKEICEILLKHQRKKPIKAVFHCFTSTDKKIVNTIIENNWYFGFGGVITFKKSHQLREILKYIYQNKGNIICETDSPYISPEPYRGKKNFPYNVKIIYNYIKNLLNTDNFINNLPVEIEFE